MKELENIKRIMVILSLMIGSLTSYAQSKYYEETYYASETIEIGEIIRLSPLKLKDTSFDYYRNRAVPGNADFETSGGVEITNKILTKTTIKAGEWYVDYYECDIIGIEEGTYTVNFEFKAGSKYTDYWGNSSGNVYVQCIYYIHVKESSLPKLTITPSTTMAYVQKGTTVRFVPSVSGATIYGTTSNSMKYTSTLPTVTIDKTTTVTVRAVKQGYPCSDIFTHTYYVGEGNLFSAYTSEGVEIQYLATDESKKTCKTVDVPKDTKGNITIPPTVNGYTVTEVSGFSGCSDVSIVLPNTITQILAGCFRDCSNVTVTIPSSLEKIGRWAFNASTDLTIISKIEQPFAISSSIAPFALVTNSILYVPVGCKSIYESTDGWKEFPGPIVEYNDIIQGDVNQDDAVNGTDLVALSNIILGRKEQTSAADVNGDGSVNGTDIVALSNIILGRNKAPRRAVATGNGLSIEPFDINAGETKEMLIDLTNPNDEVTLVQFDLHLPEGLTVKKNGSDLDFDMAGRTSWRKHTLDANEVDDAYRFLLYSNSNTLIEGTEGAIIKVTVVADASFTGGKIVIDNILLVSPDEKETKPDAYELTIGSPTSDDGSAKLSIDEAIKDINAGETKEMLIDLTNPNDEVTLVQFDLHLPEGLTVKKNGGDLDFDMADRTSWRKHTLDANEVDGAYRFLLYSSSNTLIEGTEGAIIKVTVVADASFTGGKIVIDNILLVSPDEQETKPEAYEYLLPDPSGISTILMDRDKNAPVYNLRGQRLSAPQKGINIVGGRKVVVK